MPNQRHNDYSEQLVLSVVDFDDGLTNRMWVEGTLFIRLRMPKKLQKALMYRNRADYFQFGDAYEKAILRVIEQHFELFEDVDSPLTQKARESKAAAKANSTNRGGSATQ